MIEFKTYQGVLVLLKTLDLMDEIKKKNPMLSFAVGGNRIITSGVDGTRLEIKTSLDVSDIGDPSKPIGSIGFDGEDKYWVRSRLIRNDKYGQWNRSQHESKYSKHMKNIVKEANKYLKPFSYEEMVNEHQGNMDRQITNKSNITVSKTNSKVRMDFTTIFPELLHMNNTGYTPHTPKMAEAIAYAVDNREELEKYYDYRPKKCMIWVRPNSVVYEIDKQVKQVNNTAELPEELRGKLFVLDVTDKNTFVEDVGMKQDTGIYWVLLEEK